MQQYRVVRRFRSGGFLVMRRGLSLMDARVWCLRDEASSVTARDTPYRRRYNATNGEWMDVYVRE